MARIMLAVMAPIGVAAPVRSAARPSRGVNLASATAAALALACHPPGSPALAGLVAPRPFRFVVELVEAGR